MPNQPFPDFLFDNNAPETLYHYTTSAGLVGIIENNTIWATKISYLNDRSELHLAFNYIREVIALQKKKSTKEEYLFGYDDMLYVLDNIGNVNVSVVSFSSNGDQLSQWRGYSKIGDGYSIGFDGKKLKEHVNSLTTEFGDHYYLVPCQYDPKIHKELVENLINYSLQIKDQNFDSIESEEFARSSLHAYFEQNTLTVAQIIKSEAFKEENEWRLISPNLSYEKAEFRFGKHSLIPYWKIELDIINTIKSVIIGPTPEPSLSNSALYGFLLKQKHLSPGLHADHILLTGKLKIINSEIPYRIV